MEIDESAEKQSPDSLKPAVTTKEKPQENVAEDSVKMNGEKVSDPVENIEEALEKVLGEAPSENVSAKSAPDIAAQDTNNGNAESGESIEATLSDTPVSKPEEVQPKESVPAENQPASTENSIKETRTSVSDAKPESKSPDLVPKKRKYERKSSPLKEKSDNSDLDEALAVRKGKRARIPNRKYEDIPIKLLGRSFNNSFANDSVSKGSDVDGSMDEDEAGTSRKLNTPVSEKKKAAPAPVDMTNPALLRPFGLGWKRELVYRSTVSGSPADIYYYTPLGKKCRSMREVAQQLKDTDLDVDCFTFYKEAIGADGEIIRTTKQKGTPGTKSKASPKHSSPSTPVGDSSKTAKATKGFKVKLPEKSKFKMKSRFKAKTENFDLKIEKPKWIKEAAERKRIQALTSPESPPKPSSTRGRKSSAASSPTKLSSSQSKSSKVASTSPSVVTVKVTGESTFMKNYLQNLSFGYSTLLHVFQYLKMQDLLRAGRVCYMWRDIANHPVLWKTVRMKNSHVSDWEGLAEALRKHSTQHLDLRKMILPNNITDDFWTKFTDSISHVESLKKVELCKCPASVIEDLVKKGKNLQAISALAIKCERINLASITEMKNLQELRLKSTNGFWLQPDLSPLKDMTQIKQLSLTSVKELYKKDLDVVAGLVNLESLELGECNDFPEDFGTTVILKLKRLEKLRLEKGQNTAFTFNILETVSKLSKLEQLELINFDVKTGFDNGLGACKNIKKLLIIPTYISQSATTNHMVLGGVNKLKDSLSHFVWGVTLELLRVTELFVDQCEDSSSKDGKKKPGAGPGDSIPVLKPVPIMRLDETKIDNAGKEPPQVEILPLPTLQKLLLAALPKTRVKILKIPFHATWRQSLSDAVN